MRHVNRIKEFVDPVQLEAVLVHTVIVRFR